MGWKRVVDTRPLESAVGSEMGALEQPDPHDEPAEEFIGERHQATVDGPDQRVDAIEEFLEAALPETHSVRNHARVVTVRSR